MKSVNLIPAPRQVAKRRRVHLRRCAAMCAAWAVLLVVAAVAIRVVWGGDGDAQAGDRLAAVSDDIARTERAMAETRNQLAAAQSTLRAHEAIANQPDWSILLAVLARKIGDDVVLKGVRVHPAGASASAARTDPRRTTVMAAPGAGGPGGAGGPIAEPPFVLEASGMAKTHAAANRFVLELEKTGLFAKVTLLDTAREPFLVGEAIAFRLECSLDEPGNASATAPGNAPGQGGKTQTNGAQASVERQ